MDIPVDDSIGQSVDPREIPNRLDGNEDPGAGRLRIA